MSEYRRYGEVLEEPPWPWMSEKRAAEFIGVDPSFLNGMVNQSDAFRAVKIYSKKREIMWAYNQDDVRRLKSVMAQSS